MGILADSIHFFTSMGILANSLHFFTSMGILANPFTFSHQWEYWQIHSLFHINGNTGQSLHFSHQWEYWPIPFTFSHQWQYWPIPFTFSHQWQYWPIPPPPNLPVHNPGPPRSPVVYSDRVTVHTPPSGNPDPGDIPPCSKHLSCKVLFQHPSLVYDLPSLENYSQIPMP